MMKKIMISIILFLSLFNIVLFIYKYKYEKDLFYFWINEINETKLNETNDVDYKEKYKGSIIYDNLLSIDYSYFYKGNNMTGKVYISSDNYLYIFDSHDYIDYKVSEIKFKTMLNNDYDYKNGISIYLISEDHTIYLMNLYDDDVRNVQISEYSGKYTYFVDLDLKKDKYGSNSSLFALSEDDKIYNVKSHLLYDPNIISLYNKIYVYSDKTITNIEGKIILDKDKKPYKMKYIFNVVLEDEFIDNTSYIVITEDNKFLYFNEDITEVYELNKEIKKIEFDKHSPYVEGTLLITLNCGTEMWFNVECNEYFCVN